MHQHRMSDNIAAAMSHNVSAISHIFYFCFKLILVEGDTGVMVTVN